MSKRMLAILVGLSCLMGTALGETWMYVNNPVDTDRLHLRAEPSQNSQSLGKYYNGTEVLVLQAQNGWSKVCIDMRNESQTGWMMSKYLSINQPGNAMPQYSTSSQMTAYYQTDDTGNSTTIGGGQFVSVMGLIELSGGDWWHIAIHTSGSESNRYAFVPANTKSLKKLSTTSGVTVYISNPDKTDRLHLRVEPSISSKSLGKYYNGCQGIVKGFAENGEWAYIELLGRVGWMKSEFLCLEGKYNNTYYGIPNATVTSTRMPVYAAPDLARDNYEATIDKGEKLMVLGLVDNDMLHVQLKSGGDWFVYTADTDFVDLKKAN